MPLPPNESPNIQFYTSVDIYGFILSVRLGSQALFPCHVLQDLDARDRHQKQLLSNQSATDVRLNRALEELERAKSALQREKSEKKVDNAD